MKEKKLDKLLWCEKYRPKKFEDVVGLDERIPKLVDDDMPHMLFVSPPGTGKTTCAYIIVKKLECDYIVLNASDERGIDVIREKVKTFSMTLSTKKDMFKVVLLDESDYLTPEAQAILRNLMETYAKNCRFILTANFENRIIDAIKSRCSKFIFKKVSDDELLKLLKKICEKEGIEDNETVLKKIIEVSRGDIRKSINLLQQNTKDNKLTGDLISESNIKEILDKLKENKFDDVRKELIEKNVDYESLTVNIFRYVIEDKENIPLEKRKKIVLLISDCLFEMSFVLIKEIPFAKFMVKVEEILK